jgi:DNA-binding TFAR19-related protein (PDSD5 family)
METLLFKHELCVLNEGNSPTFKTNQAATCIDITVASPALASLVTKWTVQPEMNMSDHHFITMNLQIRPDKMPLRKGRHLKTAEWEEFSRLVDISLKDYQKNLLWSADKVNQVTQQLHNAMDAVLDVVAPITPYRPKKSIFSWWNSELHELRQLARRAHDHARRHTGDDDKWQDYRTKRRTLKNESLKARKKSWQQFTADQVSPKQAAKLHKILQRQAYNKLGLIRRNDRSLTESQEESHVILMQYGALPGIAATNGNRASPCKL